MKRLSFVGICLAALIVTPYLRARLAPRPELALTPGSGAVSPAKGLTLAVNWPGGGEKALTVSVSQGERNVVLLKKSYASSASRGTEVVSLAGAGLAEGPCTLVVRGGSSLAMRLGLAPAQKFPFRFEIAPLEVRIVSTSHNLRRGGAGLITYTLSREAAASGIAIADRFYPGYRQGGNLYAALFPFPFDLPPERYQPRLQVVDAAGSRRTVNIPCHLMNRDFPSDTITLSDKLLDRIAESFRGGFPQGTPPLEIFRKANGGIRLQNRRKQVELGSVTSPVPLWNGAFLRLPGAAEVGAFAQHRTYLYQGAVVDRQTHTGIDLASLAQSPVPAANAGKVVFAGDLGLYGNCVIIDHGLGLQTVYGHLSRIGVTVGETVPKGATIGATGTTGMAVGDHLHYEVMVGGEPVNPVEWWDGAWIRNNITVKLGKTLGK